jgi:hypothetical protein
MKKLVIKYRNPIIEGSTPKTEEVVACKSEASAKKILLKRKQGNIASAVLKDKNTDIKKFV